jgi:hypothetical protein
LSDDVDGRGGGGQAFALARDARDFDFSKLLQTQLQQIDVCGEVDFPNCIPADAGHGSEQPNRENNDPVLSETQ